MSLRPADPPGVVAPQEGVGVVRDQLKELWRRYQSHAPAERLLFVAVPVVVAGLVIVGAALLVDSGEERTAPAGPVATHSAGSEQVRSAGQAAEPAMLAPAATAVVAVAPTVEPAEPEAAAPPEPEPEPAPSPSPAPAPAVATAPAPSGPPRVRVANTDGEGANLRQQPSASSPRIKVIREGVELDLIGPDERVEGVTWRNVQDEAGDAGWILAQFLTAVRASGPRPTATPAPLTILVADIASPVGRGKEAFLVITTRPGVRCEVRVFLYGPAYLPREGLEPKVADGKGECGWSWKVPEETVPGTWRYLVLVGTGDRQVTREVPFGVT